MQQPLFFKSPVNDRYSIQIPAEASNLNHKFNGSLASAAGDEYPIRNNVIDLLVHSRPGLTPAQRSNFLSITAGSYENRWRKRSIGLLSGEDFSIADEQQLLLEWLDPMPHGVFLDIGCSTALYARTIAVYRPETVVVALDFSRPMLKVARKKCLEEGVNLFLVCADAEQLPFFSDSFDGLVCGGSLNEFNNPGRALTEARRVIRKGGRYFLMYLNRAGTLAGKSLQRLLAAGGLHFNGKDVWFKLIRQSGFSIIREKQMGVVQYCYSRQVKP